MPLPPMLMTVTLTDLADGRTRVEGLVAAENPNDRAAFEPGREMLQGMFAQNGIAFTKVVEEKAKAEMTVERSEPMLPVSAGRFLTEPVVRTGTAG
jgi:hypothetical protein